MKKQICTLLLCGCLLCSAGCSDGEQASSAVEIVVDSNFQAAPVPDGGWTFESLSETVRINGKSITLPFCIDQLGEDYVFDEASQVGTTYTILYRGKSAFIVKLSEADTGDLRQRKAIRFGTDDPNKTDGITGAIQINGIGEGATMQEVKEALGTPYEETDRSFNYTDADGNKLCYLLFNDAGKVQAIFYNFEIIT